MPQESRWSRPPPARSSACLWCGRHRNSPRRKARRRHRSSREQKPQPRPHGQPVAVDPASITVDDGDTVSIRWGADDVEIIRILGIDTPETRHDEHSIPLDQPFGREARAFAQGAFAVATDVKLVRADKLDPYDRTLGYLILNDKNYSALVIRAQAGRRVGQPLRRQRPARARRPGHRGGQDGRPAPLRASPRLPQADARLLGLDQGGHARTSAVTDRPGEKPLSREDRHVHSDHRLER